MYLNFVQIAESGVKMIHKGAKAFQQNWEKARLERSQVRKELPSQRYDKVRIKTILILPIVVCT